MSWISRSGASAVLCTYPSQIAWPQFSLSDIIFANHSWIKIAIWLSALQKTSSQINNRCTIKWILSGKDNKRMGKRHNKDVNSASAPLTIQKWGAHSCHLLRWRASCNMFVSTTHQGGQHKEQQHHHVKAEELDRLLIWALQLPRCTISEATWRIYKRRFLNHSLVVPV